MFHDAILLFQIPTTAAGAGATYWCPFHFSKLRMCTSRYMGKVRREEVKGGKRKREEENIYVVGGKKEPFIICLLPVQGC